jgi:transposase
MTYAPMHEKEISNRSLTDAEWECIKPHLPSAKTRGRPRIHGLRQLLDAVFYVS